MNKKFLTIVFFLLNLQLVFSQVGINTQQPNAMLDIKSDESGLLIPKVLLTSIYDTTTITNPIAGNLTESTLVFNDANNGTGNDKVERGFYFWSGTHWVSPFDAQWLKANTAFKSTGINDNVYTYGNVGINVEEPLSNLDVLGNIKLPRDRNLYIANGNLSSNNGIRLYFTNRLHWYNKGEHTYWRTSGINTGTGTENTVLTAKNSNGYISLGEGPPTQLLHVIQDNAMIDASNNLLFGRPGDNTDVIQFRRENKPNDVSDIQLWIGDNEGGLHSDSFVLGHIDLNTQPREFKGTTEFKANGVASKRSAGQWSTLSDKRVKKSISNFTDGLEKVLAIEPVTFEYNGKAGTENNGNTYVGVIAQQVAPIAPYMVEYNVNDEVNNLLSYDATALDYLLVNAMKSLSQKRDDLKSRLKVVNDKLVSLQSRFNNANENSKKKGKTAIAK